VAIPSWTALSRILRAMSLQTLTEEAFEQLQRARELFGPASVTTWRSGALRGVSFL